MEYWKVILCLTVFKYILSNINWYWYWNISVGWKIKQILKHGILTLKASFHIVQKITESLIWNKELVLLCSIRFGQFHPFIPNFFRNHASCFILIHPHPFMRLYLFEIQSFWRVSCQYFPNEIYNLFWKVDWKLNIYLENFVICLILITCGLKRCFACA